MTTSRPVRTLAEGIGMTEGPLWCVDGRLLVTSVSRGGIYEVSLTGDGALPIAWTGGGPSGLAESDHGIWIAQSGHETRNPEITDLAPGPSIQTLRDGAIACATSAELTAPNDLALGPDGRLWFTDPQGYPFDEVVDPGRLWAMDLGTGECELVFSDLQFPNGLAFNARGDLMVGETAARRVVTFRYDNGTWTEPTPFAQLDDGYPDGMAFDAADRLHVAGTHGNAVFVFDESGVICERIDLEGGFSTNCAFVGSDLDVLAITVANGGRVLAIDREIPGLPLTHPVEPSSTTRRGVD